MVAMTCTHAAITRDRLVDLGFTFDSLIIEEAAQILEVESFIPMLLQKSRDNTSRLKRIILIGDHHQLPPIVKHMVSGTIGKGPFRLPASENNRNRIIRDRTKGKTAI